MKSLPVFYGLLAATAASAETPPATATHDGASSNPMICRTVNELGSRLNRSRICLTRAEWDQRRREIRQNIDHTQTGRSDSMAGQ